MVMAKQLSNMNGDGQTNASTHQVSISVNGFKRSDWCHPIFNGNNISIQFAPDFLKESPQVSIKNDPTLLLNFNGKNV